MCKVPTTLKTTPTAESGEYLKPAAIAGVVIGSVAGVALVILGIVFLARRILKRRQEPQDQSHDPSPQKPQDQSYGPEPQNQIG